MDIRRKKDGFTLVEIIVSLLIVSGIIFAITTVVISATNQASSLLLKEEAKQTAEMTYNLLKERLSYAGEVYVSTENISSKFENSMQIKNNKLYYNNKQYSGKDYLKVNYDLFATKNTMEITVYILDSKDKKIYTTTGKFNLDTIILAKSQIDGIINTLVTNPIIYFNSDYERIEEKDGIVVDGMTEDWEEVPGCYQHNAINATWFEYIGDDLVYHMHDENQEYDIAATNLYNNGTIAYTLNNKRYSYPIMGITSYYPVILSIKKDNAIVNLGTSLDGWKKKSAFGYYNNTKNMHRIQMSCDEKNLYVRIKYAANYNCYADFDAVNITVKGRNGNKATISNISIADKNYFSLPNNTSFKLGANEIIVYANNLTKVGYGYYIVNKDYINNEVELCMPLTTLQSYQADFKNIDVIDSATLNSSNITNPYWGIVSCQME